MKAAYTQVLLRSVQVFALAAVLYVLSPGPLGLVLRWINGNRELDDEWLQTLYRPISWANEHSTTFQRFMSSYLAMWDSSKADGD